MNRYAIFHTMLSMALTGPSDSPPFCSVEIPCRPSETLNLSPTRTSETLLTLRLSLSACQRATTSSRFTSRCVFSCALRDCPSLYTVCHGNSHLQLLRYLRWEAALIPSPVGLLIAAQISRHRCSTQLSWFLIFVYIIACRPMIVNKFSEVYMYSKYSVPSAAKTCFPCPRQRVPGCLFHLAFIDIYPQCVKLYLTTSIVQKMVEILRAER